MKLTNKAGFTIIEVMLFLGITGLLAVGILVGTGATINIQRYRDSVTSLQAVLQQQYSKVTNISNDQNVSLSCSPSGNSLSFGQGGSPRGQSDCIILGRIIDSQTNGNLIRSFNVIGLEKPSGSINPNLTGVDNLFSNYSLDTDPDGDLETFSTDWGTTLSAKPLTGSESNSFVILIVRLPDSGLIKTFVKTGSSITNQITDLVSTVNETDLKICINPNGLFGGSRMAVQIKAGATSASGVEILGDATSGC